MVLRPRVAFIYSNVVLWPVWQNGAADASGWVTSATGRIVFPHLFSIFSVVDALLWAVIYNKTSHFMFTPSTGISVVRLVPDPSSIFYDQIHRCQWVCEWVCVYTDIYILYLISTRVSFHAQYMMMCTTQNFAYWEDCSSSLTFSEIFAGGYSEFSTQL